MTVPGIEIRHFSPWAGHYTEWYNTEWAKRSCVLVKEGAALCCRCESNIHITLYVGTSSRCHVSMAVTSSTYR